MSRFAHARISAILAMMVMGATIPAHAQIRTGLPSSAETQKTSAREKSADVRLGKSVQPGTALKRYPGLKAPASGGGGRITFESGKPALPYQASSLHGARDPIRRTADGKASKPVAAGEEFAPQPGTLRANMPPVSVEQFNRTIATRQFPDTLNRGVVVSGKTVKPDSKASAAMRIGGDNSPQGPASVAELARSLRYHPDLIYQYVRNNIEFYPAFGVQKGALGTILDNQGTAYDQATLMVELLRASGYTASYVRGIAKITAAEMAEWYGIDTSNVCGVVALLGQAQIPIYEINATSAGSCPGSTAAMTNVSLEHVWVKTNIGGTDYYFDPSYKPHSFKTGIDLASPITTGYNAAAYLASATSGATITADYVQNINRTNIRNNLTTYANNLATHLRTNLPSATLDDVIGGQTITQFYGSLRDTAPPRMNTAWATVEYTDVPNAFKPTVRIQYQGIDQTYTSDAIYGKRLTITYNTSRQPLLKLDGVTVAGPGTAVVAGAATTVNFTVTHNAYVETFANHSFDQVIRGAGTNTFLIANGWGPAGRGGAQKFQSELNGLRASGAVDSSEPVLGSSLAVIAAQWIAQNTHVGHITERISGTNLIHHHQVGIAGYVTNGYVDLPSNMVSVANVAADLAREEAAFTNWGMHLSILESTAVQQTTGISAVSTVKLIDLASGAGQRIYNATSANYASAVQPNLVNCSAHLGNFSSYLASGLRLILPTRCDIAENTWSGVGYFTVGSGLYLGSIISNGLSGGYSTLSQTTANFNYFSGTYMPTTPSITNYSGSVYGDPVDMVAGNFLYDHEDISVGVGSFPQSLAFKRLYSSGMRNQSGAMGRGWTHNFKADALVNSDGFQAMGEDSALDAVGTLVEMKASFDLLTDTTKPIAKLVAAALGQRWFGDQLIGNTVVVTQGVNGEVFVKLPDGSYNPPPGKSAKLTKNVDGTFNYETVNRGLIKFNASGQAVTYTDPSGVQLKYTYSGANLISVANSLGRSMTFTYTSGRITKVTEGARSVSFAYDANANLTTFTDTLAKQTKYAYAALPGQMTSLFYPSFPTVSAATNVYDSLGRVKQQTNARGKVYDYYFAGFRTEEVGPGNTARTSYIDASGNVIQQSTPMGNWTINAYDGQSRLFTKLLPEGNYQQYAYDDATCAAAEKRCTHNVKSITQVAKPGSGLANLVQSFTYESAFNRVASAVDARGNTTTYTYTAQGLPLKVTSPTDAAGVAPETSYTYVSYTPSGFPTFYLPATKTEKTTASNSVVTTTTYNTSNKYVPQTSTVDSGTGKLNLATTFTYDVTGNLTVVNGPRTDVTDTVTTAYNSQRQPTQVTNALSKATRTVYDADGRPTTVAKQVGTQWLVSCSRYSETGKVTRSWGPGLMTSATTCPTEAAPVSITDTAYDDLDRPYLVTQRMPAAEGGDRVTQTVYNADDTVQVVKKAVGTALEQSYVGYVYTPNGNVDSSHDAKNNLTVYQYDGFDRLARTYYPLPDSPGWANAGDYEENGYDANGNIISLRKRSGQTIAQIWDKLNRLTARNYPTVSDDVQFAYDLRGLRTAAQFASGAHTITYAWDNAGRLGSTNAGGKTLVHMYDPAGNRTRTTWPDAFYTTTTYDALNRPTAIKESGSINLAGYAYDDLSRRTTVTLGNGTSIQRTYDNQGSLATLKNFLASTAQEVQYTYVRNQIRELKSVTWSNNIYQWMGAAPGTQNYTANGLNRYTVAAGATMGYDGNGNLTGDGTWTYGYDLDNRLKTANTTGLSAALAYDAEGRLRQTAIGSNTINLLYDGQRLVAEYDAAGTAVLRKYVHGPGSDEPIVWYEGTGTTAKNWLYTDHLGSVVATGNATGASTATYTYGPFGEPNVSTGLRFRYTGQQLIGELGLYYYKARFYSPAIGRFLQVDPIGYQDDQNLYAYVSNNPSNRSDPLGLAAVQGGFNSYPSSSFEQQNASTLISGMDLYEFSPSGTALSDGYQVAWVNPTDMINPRARMPFDGGAGGGGGSTGGGGAPNYVVTPGGTAYPVPSGAVGPSPVTSRSGQVTGTAFTGGSGGANGQVDTIRIMNPTRAGGGNPGHPNGYIIYNNANGQAVNPATGRTAPRHETHFPIDMP